MLKEDIKSLFETKFIKVFDLQYAKGAHYFNASRREIDNLPCTKTDEEFKAMLPDAVTCVVILKIKDEEPKLLMSYEYRYPAGQFLLSPPAGLIDPEDRTEYEKLLFSLKSTSFNDISDNELEKTPKTLYESVLYNTAKREILEETGIEVKPTDSLEVINPLLFSSPGMTDESNALVLACISLDDLTSLNQDGAVGSELFDGFRLLSKEDAKKILKAGHDEHGIFYSVYTWCALMYFIYDMWSDL